MGAVLRHAAIADAPPPPTAKPRPNDGRPRFHRPSREGKRLVAAYVEPRVAKQIKLLAAEDETTVQALIEEALDLLFVKKGKGPLIGLARKQM